MSDNLSAQESSRGIQLLNPHSNKPHVNTPIVHDQREAQEAIHDDRAKGFNARATMQWWATGPDIRSMLLP